MSRWDFVRQMFAATPPSREDQSVISVESSVFGGRPGMGTIRYNPDDLVRRKGLAIYAKMRLDEQVKAVCVFKRDAIISRGWTLEYSPDSDLPPEEQEERKSVIKKLIDRMDGSFIDALNVISTGREYGFSLTEKVYQTIDIKGTAWTGLKKLVGRDPTTFEFETDNYGELIRCVQTASGTRIELDLAKFIYYVHSPEFDVYYGRSDLREAYRSWYIKDQTINFWAMHLERFGAGFMLGKATGDMAPRPGTAAYTALQNAMANARNGAAVIAPQDVDIQIQYPSTTDAYERACTWHDLAIARSLLVPNLLGVSHAGQTGSFAQSQTQLEAFAWTISADKNRIEAVLTDQLIRDLVTRNWGDDEYPVFRFNPVSNEQLRWMVNTWSQLIGAGAVIPTEEDEARLRVVLEMPARSEESVRLQPVPSAAAPAPVVEEVEPEEVEEVEPQEVEAPAPQPTRAVGVAMSCLPVAAFNRAEQRVNFEVIDRRQSFLSENLTRDMAEVTARAAARLMGNDEQLGTLTDSDPTDIGGLDMSGVEKGRLKTLATKALNASWRVGQQMAIEEIAKTGRVKKPRVMMADLRENAAQFFEANGFRMAGNLSEGVRSVIQQELLSSVKFGRSPAQTREAIWLRLTTKGFTTREAVRTAETSAGVLRALDALWADDPDKATAYLDTLARTNLFEAMNEARYAEYTDPELSDFVLALRYSAILDSRTTEICTALHDRVYKADNPVWDDIRPPNHYNCRSVLVPITEIDLDLNEWDGQESSPPTVQPQEGFGNGA